MSLQSVSYSYFRQHLKSIVDEVIENHEPILMTSRTNKSVVLLSYEDYCSLEETACLLRSPVNTERLAIANKQTDVYKKQELI